MCPNDDDLDLEGAWEDLRGGPIPPPREPEKPQRGFAWMGFGPREGVECDGPGYERQRIRLYLDGSEMEVTYKLPADAPVEVVRVTWVGMWFTLMGGRPFYSKEINPIHIHPGDSATFHLVLTDEGGYLVRTLEALDLL
jgi:hypothetical protein